MKPPKWLTTGVLVLAAVKLFDQAQSTMLFGPFPTLLDIHGMRFLVPWISWSGTFGALLGSFLAKWFTLQVGTKKITIISFFVTTITPLLYAFGIINQAIGWLLVTRFIASFAGALSTIGTFALLRMILSPDSKPHQKGNALNITMGAVGSSLAIAVGFGFFIEHPLLWGSTVSVLNTVTLVSFIRLRVDPEVDVQRKPAVEGDFKKTRKPSEVRYLIGEYFLPYIGMYMAHGATQQYAPYSVQHSTWLKGGISLIVYATMMAFGSWIAIWLQRTQNTESDATQSEAQMRKRAKKVVRFSLVTMVMGLVIVITATSGPVQFLIGFGVIAFAKGLLDNPLEYLANQTNDKVAVGAAKQIVFNLSNLPVAGLAVFFGMENIWLSVLLVGPVLWAIVRIVQKRSSHRNTNKRIV